MENESWHLDKRVPITMIAAILLQTVAFIVSGTLAFASLSAESQHNSNQISVINRELEFRREMIQGNSTAVAVLGAQLTNMQETQKRILDSLSRIEANQKKE